MSSNKPNYETMNYQARRNKIDSNDATQQLDRIFARDRGICHLCGLRVRRDEASRDHIKEFKFCTKEEARSDENMRLAHIVCNNSRGRGMKPKIRVIVPNRDHLSYTIEEAFPDFKNWFGFFTSESD